VPSYGILESSWSSGVRTSSEFSLGEVTVHAQDLVSRGEPSTYQESVNTIGSMKSLKLSSTPTGNMVKTEEMDMILTTASTLRRDSPEMFENLQLQALVVHSVLLFPLPTNTVTVTVVESLFQLPDSRMLVSPAA
jgi:hypothetical protein